MNITPSLSVLVVDDNADLAQSMAWLLEMYGHAVRVALSGEQAIAAVADAPPDVAVVDIMMPRMDGFELTRRLREACGARLFIVIASGLGAAADVKRAHDAGANLHLLKPVDPVALGDLLHAFRDGAMMAAARPGRSGVQATS
jgi:two-component system, chemotaxis family, CheB/CheR fusion protein